VVFLGALFVGLQACSSKESISDLLVGTWTGEVRSASPAFVTTLILRGDGTFSSSALPVSVACPDVPDLVKVSGSGIWRVDERIRRIELNLAELSSSSCVVPYLANAFAERSLGDTYIVAFPDGTDNVSTAIRFERKK
jgi:hypothetical protein